jgi:hypothetical protein
MLAATRTTGSYAFAPYALEVAADQALAFPSDAPELSGLWLILELEGPSAVAALIRQPAVLVSHAAGCASADEPTVPGRRVS